MAKVCPQCGISFETTNPRKVYCETKCRVNHHRATKPTAAPPTANLDVILPTKKNLLDLNFKEIMAWLAQNNRILPNQILISVYEDWRQGTLILTAPSKEEEKRDQPLTNIIPDAHKIKLKAILDELAKQTASKGSV